ncbi:MAG: hypothetical protein OXF44_00605 [Anaerolineaceae bacterium]|nr:hypothetical protein [Anaerolineaceae bacterium]
MSEIQIFHATLDGARELEATPFRNEKELQGLVERHLPDLTGIDFVATEHRTGSRHKRRADTLGLDSQQRPVVIEYKLGHGGPAISQGLDYLYWLEDHKGDFRELVRGSLGADRARNIDFKNTRLLCVAGEFRREDIINADTNTRSIELLCVRRHGASTILMEWVLRDEKPPKPKAITPTPGDEPDYSKFQNWEAVVANALVHGLFNSLCDYVCSLSETVKVNPTKYYFSFMKGRTFSYVFPQPHSNRLKVYVNAEPGHPHFLQKRLSKLPEGHAYPPCNAQLFVDNQDELEEAKQHLSRSYEEAG